MSKSGKSNETAIGCIVYLMLAVILMPVVGLYLISNRNSKKKTLGYILLVVGIVMWIIVGVSSGS